MTPEMAAGVDVAPSNGERSRPEDRHRYSLEQRLRQLRNTARLKMRCFAVWSVMPVTVILVVDAQAAEVSARDLRLVPGGDGIAEAATHRTAPGHLTRPDGREETLAALRFRWPVYGPISSDFGAPRASRTGFHAGVDIGASRGTFVRAPAGGTVAFIGWRRGYGRTIVIDHGHQISTLYGHLAKPDVVRGQTVEEGAGIGLIGATGHASGPHLHYEVLVNGRPVNPRLVFANHRTSTIDPGSRRAEQVNAAAQRLGVELVRGEPALGAKATIVASTPALGHLRDREAAPGLKNRLPTAGFSRSFAEAGFLMSYGMPPDLRNQRAADYVDKIVTGARPAELPVQ
jgi:murein DD-endopeptidase MepM/ murein hydrolase activator NlpD